MPYRVTVTKDGLYRATLIADQGFNVFECKYWHVFEQELKRRLLNEKNKKIREVVTVEKEGKSDTEIF